MINYFFKKLAQQSIIDLLQIGVVEIEDGVAEMTTMHIYLFIEFEEYILKLESINQYSKLKIKLVDEAVSYTHLTLPTNREV